MQQQFEELVERYDHLLPALHRLVEALEAIEPGGTLADEIVIKSEKHGTAFVTYCAKPLQVTIERHEKKYILKVVDVK